MSLDMIRFDSFLDVGRFDMAHLSEALQVNIASVFQHAHLLGSSWYGSEGVVDQWLSPAMTLIGTA